MFKGVEDSKWVKTFVDLSNDQSMQDEIIEKALFAGATNWPRAIIEGVRDAIKAKRPILAQQIDRRLEKTVITQ